MTNLITVSNGVKESEYGKILFSDVLVTKKRNLFMGRKWRTHDIRMVLWFLFIHLLALLAPYVYLGRILGCNVHLHVVWIMRSKCVVSP
ncbi:putative acyl-CoA desaturase [Helianthus debilis subsp. tardiflorus]